MSGQTAERRAAQDELIVAKLARGGGYADAAATAGVSARTVRRRMADPEFALVVSMRRAERVGEVTGRLVEASLGAVRVLEDCLGSEVDSVRLRAARTLIELGQRLRASSELEARLARLEGGRGVIGDGAE